MAKKHGNGVQQEMPLVARSSAGLRDALFDEMDRLRQGTTNATNANALARLAATIVDSVEMEVAVHKFLVEMPAKETVEHLPKPLPLT